MGQGDSKMAQGDSKMEQGDSSAAALKLGNITIKQNSVCAQVHILGEQRALTPTQAHVLLEQMPSLANHACKSHGYTTFGERIVGALLPHVLEHVTIDLLAQRHPGVGAIAGNSVRLNNTSMLVRISRSDDIAPDDIKAALMDAARLVNAVL
jgi:hypothetical protein